MNKIKRTLLDSSLERLVVSSRSGGRVIPMRKIVDLALSVEEAKYVTGYLIDNGIMAASSREYIEDKLSITYPANLEEFMKQGDVPFKENGVVSIFDNNLENLRLVFGILKPRYQEFIKYKFGYDGGEETSITKTGAHFGVSNARASQIIRSSIDKLREAMFDNGYGEDFKVKKK